MFEYNLYLIFFYYCWQNLIYIKTFFTTIIITWLVCWYRWWWQVFLRLSSYQFSSKAEFTSPFFISHHSCSRHWRSRIAVGTTTWHNYPQNILKLLAFKCFLNDVLLEIECSKVMLICWFVSITCIKSF